LFFFADMLTEIDILLQSGHWLKGKESVPLHYFECESINQSKLFPTDHDNQKNNNDKTIKNQITHNLYSGKDQRGLFSLGSMRT
jgi:hypothetical protein